jgi:hypothetical protein
MMTAAHAIETSIANNEIVHMGRDEDAFLDLLTLSDDHAESDSEWEFWGESPSGYEWRVHVAKVSP